MAAPQVFCGTYLGQSVAIKTLHNITEETVKLFRAEILLTATLRHVNVVAFVGACWCRDLMGLVTEQ